MGISLKGLSIWTLAAATLAVAGAVSYHAYEESQDDQLIKNSKDKYLSGNEADMKSLFKDWEHSKGGTKAIEFGYRESDRDIKFALHDMFLAAHENQFHTCLNYRVDTAWRRRVTELELNDHKSHMPNDKFVAVVVSNTGRPGDLYLLGTSCDPKP